MTKCALKTCYNYFLIYFSAKFFPERRVVKFESEGWIFKWIQINVMKIDIDHFKKINDTYGHQTGDIVLQEFGKTLSDFIKSKESVSRFGGEEFMILIPNKSTNDVYERIESLRKLIESKDMQIDHNVTASFGIASTTGKIDFKSLIEKADNALYVAKNNGRNCIKRESE